MFYFVYISYMLSYKTSQNQLKTFQRVHDLWGQSRSLLFCVRLHINRWHVFMTTAHFESEPYTDKMMRLHPVHQYLGQIQDRRAAEVYTFYETVTVFPEEALKEVKT